MRGFRAIEEDAPGLPYPSTALDNEIDNMLLVYRESLRGDRWETRHIVFLPWM
jgi:hypothetical protein